MMDSVKSVLMQEVMIKFKRRSGKYFGPVQQKDITVIPVRLKTGNAGAVPALHPVRCFNGNGSYPMFGFIWGGGEYACKLISFIKIVLVISLAFIHVSLFLNAYSTSSAVFFKFIFCRMRAR